MNMRTIFFIIFLTLCLALSFGQEVKYNTPQAGNPIIPGYFADPTIQKFGDTNQTLPTMRSISVRGSVATLLRMEMVEDSVLHKCGLQRIL